MYRAVKAVHAAQGSAGSSPCQPLPTSELSPVPWCRGKDRFSRLSVRVRAEDGLWLGLGLGVRVRVRG